MPEENTNILIEYEENCHYYGSSVEKKIVIPLQNIIGHIDIIDFTGIHEDENGNNNIYYTETIQIIAYFMIEGTNRIVKYGNVNFYYINKDDHNRNRQLINIDGPISIDKNGNAQALFIPPEEGTIEVEYIGEPHYNNTLCTQNFTLHPMPTKIKFKKPPAYLTSKQDTIDLEVEVRDINDNKVNYGIVTFLNYSEHNINSATDGHEKVIGNPAYVQNGIAKIKYSPIQDEADNPLYGEMELIKAVYNYNNTLYGVNWKYYNMSKDYTIVGIPKNNYIELKAPVTNNITLDNNIGGLFIFNEGDNITLKCSVREYTENTDVSLFLADMNNNIVPYEQTATLSGEEFKAIFEGIPAGEYVAYAFVNTEAQNGADSVEGTIPFSNVTNEPIIQQSFVQGTYSNSLYIKVENKTYNYDVVLKSPNKDTVAPNIPYEAYLEITTESPDIFINQKCFFKINGKTIQGTLTQHNNKIIGEPNTPIKLTSVGNYVLSAYVPAVKDKYNKIYASNYLNIQVREELKISLAVEDETYPKSAKCIVKLDNIYHGSYNVAVKILQDNQAIRTYTFEEPFSEFNTEQEYTLPRLNAGQYVLQTFITDNRSINDEKIFNINKGELIIYENSEHKVVNTSIQTDLTVGMQNGFGINIITTTADIRNHLKAEVKYQHNDQIIKTDSTPTITISKPSDEYYLVSATTKVFDAGTWFLTLYMTDNYLLDNYNFTKNNISFQAINVIPYVTINSDATANYHGKVQYNNNNFINISDNTQTIYTMPQNILIITELTNTNNNKLYFMHITDQLGNFTITKPDNIANIDWTDYTKAKYIIDPKIIIDNRDVREIISTSTNNYTKFKNTFNDYIIQFNATDYENLKTQLASHKNITLFLGYNSVEDITIITYNEVN